MRAPSIAVLSGWALLSFGCATTTPKVDRTETLFVESFDGLRLAYDDRGTGDCLLFVHGLCCERGFWTHSATKFARDYRVITMDLGGHGESGTNRESWTLDDMAGDVVALVRHLDLSELTLIGHSMGGPVSLLATEQLDGRVRGIVAVEALHDPDMKMDIAGMQPYLQMMADDYAGFWELNIKSAFPEGADPEIMERVLKVGTNSPFEVTHGLMVSFTNYDSAETLRTCRVPVRCINAEMYPMRLEASQAIAKDYDAVTLDGVGHFLMLEDPEGFAEQLADILASLRSL